LIWGIIVETKKNGIYLSGKQAKPKNDEQLAWLAEAALISRNETQMALSELCNHQVFFPSNWTHSTPRYYAPIYGCALRGIV
jgi:hypothetical protein